MAISLYAEMGMPVTKLRLTLAMVGETLLGRGKIQEVTRGRHNLFGLLITLASNTEGKVTAQL